MSTVKVKSAKKGSKKVSSKKVVFEKGTMGFTSYKSLIPLKSNRGRKLSYDKNRVNSLAEILGCDWLDMAGSRVTINCFGKILDGHHTALAFEKLEKPIPYYVSTSDTLNTKNDKKLIIPISDYNSWNSKWTKKDAFDSANEYEFDLAIRINDIINHISVETNKATNKIAKSWVFALLHKNKKLYRASKDLDKVRAFDNDELVKYSETPEFAQDLQYFITILNEVRHLERFVAPVFEILDLHWSNAAFDIDRMIKRIKVSGFTPINEKQPSLRSEIQKVYNTTRGRTANYDQIYKGVSAHKEFNGSMLPTYAYVK